MIKIVKYLMHKNGNGNLITPYFIEDGGHFIKEGEMVGLTYDDTEVYVPETLTVLTNEELVTHVKSLTMSGEEGILSDDDKETMADQWLSQRGI